jgi:phosphatidylglycerophosphatase A
MLRAAALFIATGAFTGFFPFAPGTVGSALAILIDRGLRASGSELVYGLAIVVVSVVGVLSSQAAEKHFARKDPSQVVVDEVAGMLVSLYLLPVSWMGLVVGFLLFRLMDIIKPFPCRRAERLPGGLGIMVDDLLAGVYANLLLRLASWVWPALLVGSSMGAGQ